MYCVYAMGPMGPEATELKGLAEALKLAEVLRAGGFKYVTMAHENPNMVGKQGVAAPSVDYNWLKRRTELLRKDVKVVES